jgi:hypothetical protein
MMADSTDGTSRSRKPPGHKICTKGEASVDETGLRLSHARKLAHENSLGRRVTMYDAPHTWLILCRIARRVRGSGEMTTLVHTTMLAQLGLSRVLG